ncbi:hypothetical protein MAR_012750 [Mya arenaria]|uniref:Uncharacterized protein n=1 Tax=Mya arenaria TaxID=6604 RepID=A0ABY7G1U9_MYAAR|nr:hypothetical protein MAR_012750 [Mya arenaria]
MASAILSLNIKKCPHYEGIRCLRSVNKSHQIGQIWREYHPTGKIVKAVSITGTRHDEKGEAEMELEESLRVEDVLGFNIKYITFVCKPDAELEEFHQVLQATTTKTLNAFELLMAKGRDFPNEKKQSSGKSEGLHRKDELYNDLLKQYFRKSNLDFPKSVAQTQGGYFVQVLCNALWYLTNHHDTINGAAMRQKHLLPIPMAFEAFTGYNDVKRKKAKAQQLGSHELESHSEALYSLLLKPCIKNSEGWQKACDNITNLADCMKAYKLYLETRAEKQNLYHSLGHPVRTVDEFTTVENRKAWLGNVHERYSLLDEAVRNAGLGNPVYFDEAKCVATAFENNVQRYRFFQNLCLSVPVDIYRFSPGGSVCTSYCFVQVEVNRSEPQMLTDAARMAGKLKQEFSEFHTRAQRKVFKEKLANVVSIMPAVADLIYKELCIDRTAAIHPDTQERIRLIFMGEEGLLTDLRHLNLGRPSDYFDVFFGHLSDLVEEVTAADERRHNTAHLSQWISLSDMIDMAAKRCPENTPIPSKSLVRLQFAPRNPYSKTAYSFTSRIDVQYKIQRRQLRATHVDQHYCAALLKYFKEKAVELGEKCIVVCCDDKAKVPIGEPGFSVSTGVRGKKTIAPTATTLVAADHDMTKASITPSVILQVQIPDSAEKSFVQGQVSVSVNDSVFQVSTPMRHAASLSKMVPLDKTKILMKYSDGGTDHRTTLEAVRCAAICLFKEYDLDMVILARCAPGHSWRNPAERVMSIMNLGLQNCSLERESSTDVIEKKLKSCSSMKSVRDAAAKQPELKAAWVDSVEPVQASLRNRFQRLKLKEVPFQTFDPVQEDDLDLLRRHLRELFPQLDLGKLQKAFTGKCKAFQSWILTHCRERHYSFQIKKICCLPPTSAEEDLKWLPDPIMAGDGEHYMKYAEAKLIDTTEADRPTLKEKAAKTTLKEKAAKPKPAKRAHTELNQGDRLAADDTADVVSQEEPVHEASMYTAQHARATIECTECRKPRVIYGKQKMSSREEVSFAILVSGFDYTCGAPITPPESSLHGKYVARQMLVCNTPLELAYYSSNISSPKDTCAHCGIGEGVVDLQLKKRYKTVLPLCEQCKESGKMAIVHRPFAYMESRFGKKEIMLIVFHVQIGFQSNYNILVQGIPYADKLLKQLLYSRSWYPMCKYASKANIIFSFKSFVVCFETIEGQGAWSLRPRKAVKKACVVL